MRTTLVAAVAFAATALGQGTQGLPKCAASCVTSDFGGCGNLNVACICSNKSLIANLACCVGSACNTADQEATLKFAQALCGSSGVTDLPSAATCAPGAVSTPVSGTAASGTGTASSTATVTGTTTTETSGSSTASSTAAGTTGASSTAASTTAASSGSTAATSAAASASSTGSSSGNRLEAAVFGAGALAFGALAAL